MAEGCSALACAAEVETGEARGEAEHCSHESESSDGAAQPLDEKVQKTGSGARERKICNADHSLGDMDLIADLEAATAESVHDFPHVLKSFYMWMDDGPSKKSAKSYTAAVKRMMVSHRKTLSAMTGDQYFEFVKTSVENLQCNSLVSAALKKLCTWLSERSSSLAGPWEHRAANFEVLFNISNGLTPWGGAPLPAAPEESGLSTFFGKAVKRDHVCSTPPPGSRDTALETPLKKSRAELQQDTFLGSCGTALTTAQLAKIQANRAAALARREAYLRDAAKIEANRTAALARREAYLKDAARASGGMEEEQ
eukprot:CAMPEP_0171228772 /NCGR_PEP_ID=MMETSP0790-20130122/38540_1 /TAXON_ID=2925 /ORGANISM="Alexandrium catenella, Strain OF101" /LENGTH=310 /DNA_ID=CAMNT_0011694937 /DNA_START=94 /DNA_END=1026 /DNA_ORIENTATION=-